MVQWLGLRSSTAGKMGSVLVRELRSCLPFGVAKKRNPKLSNRET